MLRESPDIGGRGSREAAEAAAEGGVGGVAPNITGGQYAARAEPPSRLFKCRDGDRVRDGRNEVQTAEEADFNSEHY